MKEKNGKVDIVINGILNYIIQHNLKVGDKLPSEEELTALLGVSRVSLREGLQGLKFHGLIKSSTKGGTRICSMDYGMLNRLLGFQIAISDFSYRQLMEARLGIEMAAVDLLVHKITPGQIEELRVAADCTRRDSAESRRVAINHDRDFHLKLVMFTGNEILISCAQLLNVFFDSFDEEIAVNSDTTTRLHLMIVDALASKNLDLVRGLMRSHIQKYIQK